MTFLSQKKSGYLIIETLVSLVILSILVVSLIPIINFLLKRHRRSQHETQASLLLQEGIEAAYNIYTYDWHAHLHGDYYLSTKSVGGRTVWFLQQPAPGPLLETRFYRYIKVNKICRSNFSGEQTGIWTGSCPGGSSVDAHSILIQVIVEWDDPASPLQADLLIVSL